jgi:membrane-associated phospholipid phosphatase
MSLRAARTVLTTCVLAGCAATHEAPAPAQWRTWTAAPVPAAASPRLDELVVRVAGRPHASNDAYLARWTATPVNAPWTELAMELVVKYQQNPLRAARVFALVHVAMHDAVVVAARSSVNGPARLVAAHRAAGMVLAHLYPAELPGRLEGLGIAAAVAVALAHRVPDEAFTRAFAAGSGVGDAAIRHALTDGSGRIWPVRLRPAHAPGQWVAAPPLNLYDPAEAFAGTWRTWALRDGAEIAPPPPVPFDSAEYWREAQEVLDVTRALTPAQKKVAEDWHLDHGSVTPPGVWNRKALELARKHRLDDEEAIRLFAALDVAMYDALVACWNAKYKWWTQRPVNAIRARFDPQYLPYLITPAFPSYVSGHASVSGAAAAVIAAFLPAEKAELDRLAAEATRSRLYGGIHFESDNREGLALGSLVGRRTSEYAGIAGAHRKVTTR